MPRQRRSLSVPRIVEAAIEVADAEGIDAVTMRRLAEALDVHPTSIYSHLDSKEAILQAMADSLFASMALPEDVGDWRAWVRTLALELRQLVRAHPGGFMALTRAPVTGPMAQRQVIGAYDAFRSAGFGAATAMNAVAGCSLALLGLALNECPPTDSWSDAQAAAEKMMAARPDLAGAAAEADRQTDGVWEVVVDSLVDGLAQQLPTRRSAARRKRSWATPARP